MTCAYISSMRRFHPSSLPFRTRLLLRITALALALGTALAAPATAVAEGVVCAWGLAQHGTHATGDGEVGNGFRGGESRHGTHGAPGEGGQHGAPAADGLHAHHATASEGSGQPGTPPEPCPCPHPCGPCAVVAGIPAAVGTVALPSHPVPDGAGLWDTPSLPIFDPLLVPSGPDPPAPPFLR